MKIELFEIDTDTRLVNLNKPWITTIKEFKAIVKRDRGSTGDTDGRIKLQALKELTFIYHFCDFKSKFREYSEDDKYLQCLHNSDLPPKLNIYEDEVLMAAVMRYKKFQETASLKLLEELKANLHTAYKVVRKMRESLEKKLLETNLDDVLIVDDEKKKTTDPITLLTTRLSAIIAISNQIPDALKKIEELEDRVKKELGDDQTLRGDAEKGIREDAGFKKQNQSNPLETL